MSDKKIRRVVFLSIILIAIGISLLLNDYIVSKREVVFTAMNLELSQILEEENKQKEEAKQVEEKKNEENQKIVEEEKKDESDYETYAGILSIPKINFSRGFYQKGSSLNNVKFNIKILDSSSYPNEDKGNTILIGHSGNYSNSYFADLYHLEVGDTASIQYQEKNYHYKITNIYTDTKDGTVTIYRDEEKTCLTLITCTKDDETKQTIYILELTDIQ